MSVNASAVLRPRTRQRGGCCEPLVEPDLSTAEAVELSTKLKALADPTRLRIVDALRKAAPQAACQCELTPLFDMSQQALSKHLRVLADAEVIGSERRGVWAYYFIVPDGLEEVHSWLS